MFISIILIPALNINFKSNQVSEIDNRNLVDYKDIVSKDNVRDRLENIEAYINDRIGFRTSMVNFYTKAIDKLYDEIVHPNYQYGKEGYVFLKLPENNVDLRFQEVFSNFIKE